MSTKETPTILGRKYRSSSGFEGTAVAYVDNSFFGKFFLMRILADGSVEGFWFNPSQLQEVNDFENAERDKKSLVKVVPMSERPSWCPHRDCHVKRCMQNHVCIGELPEPELHDGIFNEYRWCLKGAGENGGVFDLKVNTGDLHIFRLVFDAIDKNENIKQE